LKLLVIKSQQVCLSFFDLEKHFFPKLFCGLYFLSLLLVDSDLAVDLLLLQLGLELLQPLLHFHLSLFGILEVVKVDIKTGLLTLHFL
jgi:hypothetical protein